MRKTTSTTRNNNTLNKGICSYLALKGNQKPFKTIDNTFDPEIHVMVKNPNGKGYIQKLRSSLEQ